jgi:hypothetical protein
LLELKVWAQSNKFSWIVTYSDNNQFEGFFRKQGFGDVYDYPEFLVSDRVTKNIEHYLRATLCAFRVQPQIDYVNFKMILQKQMDCLMKAIKDRMMFNSCSGHFLT